MSIKWWILATAILTCCAHQGVGAAQSDPSPIRNTFVISAHRAGGRVHAPDNSMPNILFAVQNQFTAVEVDLRLTRDGDIVLWHDASLPKKYVQPDAAGKIAVSALSSDQIRGIRYSATVGDRTRDDVEVVFADDLVKATRGKINLHLDVKSVPAERIIKFIRKHKIQKECMVMHTDVGYLKEVASAEPEVCLEYCDNTLGRRQIDGVWQWYPTEKQHGLYHELMKKLKSAGIDAFCTKGLTKEKVAICHEYGIMVRTSAANMQPGMTPDRYLEMGVDYALTDDPILMRQSVRRLRPGAFLSKPGQTFLELVRENGPTRTETRTEDFELWLKETPKPHYGAPVPAQISGRVVLHEQGRSSGAEGVSVTDGYSVVKTNAQGVYTLTPEPSAVFVYITRPSRCDVQGHWYKPLAARVDFALEPARDNENDYVFVHVTDTHVSENLRSVAGLRRFVQEVNALDPKPRFVVNSGDLLNLHKALLGTPASGHASFRNYVGIMNHLTVPHYSVAGDHTDSSYRLDQFPRGDHRCGKALYWEYLGPHFFSFEYGRVHFVSVDFGYHLGERQIPVNGRKLEYPTNRVQPMHVKWLKQDMANRTPGSFVVTTAESDLTRFCPGFRDIATRYDVRLQLVGDDHIVSYKENPVPCRTGGALSGCWWNPKAKQLCPDLSPQGYLIYRVSGEELDCFYKGLGQRVAIVSHRVGAPWKGHVKVQAHVVQPQPDETLEYRLDGKDWKAMREIGRPFYRALYESTVDSTSLSDGLLRFSVRSTASDEVCSREFVVVNGDNSLSFKADASLSFSVSLATNWITPRAPVGKVDVLFNDEVVGVVQPKARKDYSIRIPASRLMGANTLSFRFLDPGDGMSLNSPVLTFQGNTHRDPRDEAIRQVKAGHWGDKAAEWGGFIAGDAQPPDESPFHRRQNVFCFILSDVE